ncbi:MAG: NPCBM/NEW2 domain-containing protein [Phycisphaerae bacterium]|nr:NPCBM/NEW2 domain-containing protein [Phycisphaerae bacterium]
MTSTCLARQLSIAVLVLLCAAIGTASAGRYEAVFSDGSRIAGDKLSGWGKRPVSPKLDNTALFDAKRQLRWLCDSKLKAWSPDQYDSYIEFVGGDRIVGRIEGLGGDPNAPEHLLVKPAAPLHEPDKKIFTHVRVLPQRIERVVFQANSRRRLQPGSVFFTDGRRIGFLGLRWKDQSVVLLMKDSTRQVKTSKIAEIHLPRINHWKAYWRELAVLSPSCESRMLRVETISGLIATSSSLWFGASAYGMAILRKRAMEHLQRLDQRIAQHQSKLKESKLRFDRAAALYKKYKSDSGKQGRASSAKRIFKSETSRWERYLRVGESLKAQRAASTGPHGNAETWRHVIQPVWSLDPLWVPFNSIHMRWSFAPQRVPLSRIRPAGTINPPLLPKSENRNSAGRRLRSGGRQYAWGFAVHAYSELRFELPQCVKAFRTGIGLDRSVGSGGCARGRVYVGSTDEKPAYESPLLIGSQKTVDSGKVSVKFPHKGPKLLILQADPVNRRAPAGADPLNIRDKLDWLDPQIELDAGVLRKQIRRHLGPLNTAGTQWPLRSKPNAVYVWTSSLDEAPDTGLKHFRAMVQAKVRPLSFWRKMKIEPADKWLAVHVSPTGVENPADDAVALRVGDRQIRAQKVPIRQLWQPRRTPLLFAIDEYRGKTVTLELIQPAGGKPLHWKAVDTLSRLPAAYRLAEIMEDVEKSDMKVPFALGQALMSDRITKARKLAALKINRLGGSLGFMPQGVTHKPSYRIPDVLLGAGWTGGDKALVKNIETFVKMPGLESMVVTKDSKISDAAIAKLKARMPKLTVTRTIKRIPSHREGGRADVVWRNLTGRRIVVLYVDPRDGLRFSQFLAPGQAVNVMSNGGSRLEAHYIVRDYTHPKQYAFTLPLTTCNSVPGKIWDIKPVGQ